MLLSSSAAVLLAFTAAAAVAVAANKPKLPLMPQVSVGDRMIGAMLRVFVAACLQSPNSAAIPTIPISSTPKILRA